MKNFLLTTLSILALISFTFLTSCKQENCKTVVCANNGTCIDADGSCACSTGYEGERCETISRDKFKGLWTVQDDGSNSNPVTYAASIENGPEIHQVSIRNMNNYSSSIITANIEGDTLLIPVQPMVSTSGENSKTVQGKGWVIKEGFYGLHGKMMLQYRVTEADGTFNDFGYRGAGETSVWAK